MSFAIRDLRQPLDWDELDAASRIVSPGSYIDDANARYGNVNMINPFRSTRNHPIANLSTTLATRIFGVSENIVRWPGIFFTVLFCLSTGLLMLRAAAPAVCALLLFHTLANGLLLWYSHSMRGYISMEVCAITVLSVILLTMKEGKTPSLPLKVTFGTALILLGFCHTFGVLFYFFLMASLIAWYALNRHRAETSSIRPLILITCALSPAPLVLLWGSFVHLKGVGALKSSVLPEFFSPFLSAFGLMPVLPAKILLGATLLFTFVTFLKSPERRFSFLTLFNTMVLTALSLVFVVFRPEFFTGRFLLPFVLPLVWWCAEGVGIGRKRILATATLGVLFLGLPWYFQPDLYTTQSEQLGAFHTFARKIKSTLAAESGYCLSISGEDDQMRFLRDVYFHDAYRRSSCAVRYHAHFAKSWQGKLPLVIPENMIASPIIDEGGERILYRLIPQKPSEVS